MLHRTSIRARLSAAALLVAFQAGCAPSTTAPQDGAAQSANAAKSYEPADEPVAEQKRPAAEEAAAATAAGSAAAESAAAGESATAAEAAVETTAEAAPQEGDAAAAAGEPETMEDFQLKIREALSQNDLQGTLGWIQKARAKFPEDRELQVNELYLSLVADTQEADSGEPAEMAARFLSTAKLAEAFTATDEDPRTAQLLSVAFFHQARGLAQEGKATEAVQALERAVAKGFNSLADIGSDRYFAAVREKPEFADALKRLEASIREAMKKEASKEIAEAESFDFDFELPNLENATVKLADFRGKVVIVDVWGTWCPPCRMEIPHFVKLKETYPDDLEIVGINYENEAAEEAVPKIQQFIKEQGINYPCVLGDTMTRDRIPEFQGFPTTLFIDRTGKVRLKAVGYHPYEKLQAYLDVLLAEEKSSG